VPGTCSSRKTSDWFSTELPVSALLCIESASNIARRIN